MKNKTEFDKVVIAKIIAETRLINAQAAVLESSLIAKKD